MRHTDMKLTMNVYTDPKAFKLAGVVEKLQLPASQPVAIPAATIPVEVVRVLVRVSKSELDVSGESPVVSDVDLLPGNEASRGYQIRQV